MSKLEEFFFSPELIWLFEEGPVVIFIWENKEGWPVSFVTSNVKKVTGYTKEEFLNHTIFYRDIISESDINRVTEEVEASLRERKRKFQHDDYRIITKQGRKVWVNDFTTIKRDEDSCVTHFIGYVIDVTERKTTELQLKTCEQRWQFALEGTENAVWDWDAQTNRVFYSKKWKEMLGYFDEEIGDQLAEWDSRIHPEDRDEVYKKLRSHLKGETEFYESIYRLRCKENTYKWILDKGKVIRRDGNGDPIRVIGTHTDLFALKKLEKQFDDTLSNKEDLPTVMR